MTTTGYLHFIALIGALVFASAAASADLYFPEPESLWEPEEWEPIMNLESEFIRGIVDMALWEHNEETKQSLVFQSLLSGEEKMASDKISYGYRLLLTAKDLAAPADAVPGKYNARVVEQPGFYDVRLISFEPLLEGPEPAVLVVEPIVPDKGAVVEPIVPDKGAVVEPILPDKGAVVEPILPDNGAAVEPILPDQGAVVEPIVPDNINGAVVEPILSDKGAVVEPILPDQGAVVEPIVPDKGVVVEPIVPDKGEDSNGMIKLRTTPI